ncbi:uncharacterized protein LOC124275863 isoform X2 [Haliotis rubra]|uniref:uncharacterized protein LOC124275863 isoform X2 n=1 Tax=Haliotis rubra TaxID=36100 RepID=UPI001EE5A23B|nr:uncharacterized protein LOC124275863 isoform X2 [Haliotis rubra]
MFQYIIQLVCFSISSSWYVSVYHPAGMFQYIIQLVCFSILSSRYVSVYHPAGMFQYIIQLVLCVLSLLAMTGVFIASVIVVRFFTSEYDTTGCQTIYGTCVCSTVLYSSLNYTCLDIDIIRATAIGSVVMIVFGWLSTLAAAILSGMLSFYMEEFKSSSSISKSRSKEVNMSNVIYDEDQSLSGPEPYSRRYDSKA